MFYIVVLFMSKLRKELQSAINVSKAKNGGNECIHDHLFTVGAQIHLSTFKLLRIPD